MCELQHRSYFVFQPPIRSTLAALSRSPKTRTPARSLRCTPTSGSTPTATLIAGRPSAQVSTLPAESRANAQIRQMPALERLRERLLDSGFEILAVNMSESESSVRAFVGRVKVSFPLLLDSDGRAAREWGVFALPTSFLVDKQGYVMMYYTPDNTGQEVTADLKFLMKQTGDD